MRYYRIFEINAQCFCMERHNVNVNSPYLSRFMEHAKQTEEGTAISALAKAPSSVLRLYLNLLLTFRRVLLILILELQKMLKMHR
jgi:hypothetical protein